MQQADPRAGLKGQIKFGLLIDCLILCPGLTLFVLGYRLLPRNRKWMIYGVLISVVNTLLYIVLSIRAGVNGIWDEYSTLCNVLLPLIRIAILAYAIRMRILTEYFIKHNEMVKQGYYIEKARTQKANMARQMQQWAAETKQSISQEYGKDGRPVLREEKPIDVNAWKQSNAKRDIPDTKAKEAPAEKAKQERPVCQTEKVKQERPVCQKQEDSSKGRHPDNPAQNPGPEKKGNDINQPSADSYKPGRKLDW